MKTVLVTGGAGYIGSHTVAELCEAGYTPVIADDFSNSRRDVLQRLEALTGRSIALVETDVRSAKALSGVFEHYHIDAVIHFAGFKAVGESVAEPLKYYDNNLRSTITLLEVMAAHNVKRIVFSSSATVYEKSPEPRLTEEFPLGCSNPYGWSKLMNERILRDACAADDGLSAVLLRYFNPIGAHESGLIGEEPGGIPNNLMPYIAKVAAGELPYLNIYGDDYATVDGTGVRDYVHVVDLARAHVLALGYAHSHAGAEAINIGRGRGESVLEVVTAFERATGITIPYKIMPRRPGDIDEYFADTEKAKRLLGFEARFGIEQMCASAYNYELASKARGVSG